MYIYSITMYILLCYITLHYVHVNTYYVHINPAGYAASLSPVVVKLIQLQTDNYTNGR